MSKLTMIIASRELTMRFDLQAWIDVEETFGSLEALFDALETGKKAMITQLELAAITANAGERYAGREPDISAEWLKKNLSPKQAQKISLMAKAAIIRGMKRENADDDDEEPVDVVAEEIQKKTEND